MASQHIVHNFNILTLARKYQTRIQVPLPRKAAETCWQFRHIGKQFWLLNTTFPEDEQKHKKILSVTKNAVIA